MYIIVGLGNSGEEYKNTRHNTGRIIEDHVSTSIKEKAKFVSLNTFMNKSGLAVAKIIKNKTTAKKLIVIHDDMDLPLGTLKISYGRGSGGHRGVESIIKAIKTKDFIRLRVGIVPTTPTGKLKKPKDEQAVLDFILGKFKNSEEQVLQKVFKNASVAIQTIITEGKEIAMNKFN